MTQRNFQITIAVLLGMAVVLLGFIAGHLLMSHEVPAPAAGPAVVTATPSANPDAAKPAEPLPPAPAMATRWTPQQNGCTIEQTGTKFHITGINDQDGWDHWNGTTTADEYPEGDFEVSADFMVPTFKGTGNALVYLRAKTANNNQLGILYQPRAGTYQLQGWLGDSSKFSQPRLAKFGDEATAFHRLRLQYDAATQIATGWADEKQIGTLKYEMHGKIQFEMVTNTDKKGNEIDIYFDHFELLIAGKSVTPTLTP
jgi:hypothetical protein